MKRLNKFLDKIIPNLILIFIFFGSNLILNELIPYLFQTHSIKLHPFIKIYKIIFVIQVSLVTGLYLSIYFKLIDKNQQTSYFSFKKQKSLKNIINRSIVYQCIDELGSPLRCKLCNNSIIPLRARHCLDCEKCILGFDHHCVWFGQCIGITSTLKPFIQVLILAASVILNGLIPIYPIVLKNIINVIQLTWNNQSSGEILRQVWWNHWWCWAGGPIYRYLGGLYLGYYYYPKVLEQQSISSKKPSNKFTSNILNQSHTKNLKLNEPRLSVLLITGAATMILLVIIAMLIIVFKNNVLNGLSTIEIERSRRWKKNPSWDPRIKIWVPDKQKGNPNGGYVVLLSPGIPIFDLGPKRNFQQIMGNQVWHWFVPWNTNHDLNGIQWQISDHWMDYIKQLDRYEKVD